MSGYSFAQIAIFLIIVVAIVGIVVVVIRQSGINIPGWVITILWILGAALLGIFAIRVLLSAAA